MMKNINKKIKWEIDAIYLSTSFEINRFMEYKGYIAMQVWRWSLPKPITDTNEDLCRISQWVEDAMVPHMIDRRGEWYKEDEEYK